VPNVVGVKDAAGAPAETAVLMSQVPGDFDLYSGDDGLTLSFLAHGAAGVIGVATHWAGPEHKEMVRAFKAGDVRRAREINDALLDSYAFETGDDAPNPIPTKVMMEVLGFSVGPARLPMGPAPDFVRPRAEAVLAGLRARR